VKQIKKKSHMN